MSNIHACAACGGTPVNHVAEKLNAIFDSLVAPITKPLEAISRAFAPLFYAFHFEWIALVCMDMVAALGIGSLLSRPDRKDTWRTRVVWEAADVRGIWMREFRLLGRRIDIFAARSPNGALRIFDGLPRPRGLASPSLDWMDDKGIMKRKFRAAGLPVAKGGTAATLGGALTIFKSVHRPVIVKPNLGSRSRHTTTDIVDEDALIRAFHVATKLSPWAVVEEQLAGSVFRGTIVGRSVIGVLRRDPPQVRGDGVRTVRGLVEEENKDPRRRGPIFHEIALDADADAELSRQGLTWESVPENGQLVRLNQKVGRGQGATNTDVTDVTHPENIKLLEQVGAILQDPLVGIDFIIEDVTRPWTEQPRSGIIECNSLPFLDLHHFPYEGTPRDAAGALWDFIFPNTSA